jgi:succinate-semialdehyde dehydrogenase/glutarate-semialdehyde dehydrogenase
MVSSVVEVFLQVSCYRRTAYMYPKALGLHLDGEWVISGRDVHLVLDPSTGQSLGALALATDEDLDSAIDIAAFGFRRWRSTPPAARAAILSKASRLLQERIEEIANTATLEQGKPLAESRAEAAYVAALVEFYSGEALRVYGRVLTRPAGARSLVLKEPVGPAVAFCPWNFPILGPARKIAPALASGCSIILKPAEETPASAIAVARCFLDAGLPPSVLSLVFGIPDRVSARLMASPVIRKLSFTGSVAVGKHLLRLAANTTKRTTMELGGHAPVLIFDDCDIEGAAANLAVAKFRNAGQVCVSPTRFYVQESVYERFLRAFLGKVQTFKLGPGIEKTTTMGPVANPRRMAAIETLVADAREAGASLAAGGEKAEHTGGLFYLPTVVTHVPLGARAMNEEPFGPMALINSFRTVEEALEQANRLPYGLAAFAFTENGRRQLFLQENIECGLLGINTLMLSAVDAPFGGVKESGHGSEDGPEGLESFLVTKTVHQG